MFHPRSIMLSLGRTSYFVLLTSYFFVRVEQFSDERKNPKTFSLFKVTGIHLGAILE